MARVSLPVVLDLVTVAAAFAVCAAAYPFVIRGLRRGRMEQVIQAELPAEHHRKAGTPTGGGMLFVAVGVVGGLLSLRMHAGAVPGVAGLILFGLLGLWDDLTKLRVGSRGIPARLKLPIQLVLAVPVAWLAHAPQHGIPDAWAWAYVCGSSGFADHASHLLVKLGFPIGQIRVERFGATG